MFGTKSDFVQWMEVIQS